MKSAEASPSMKEKDEEERKFLLSEWILRAVAEVDLSSFTDGSTTDVASNNHPSEWPANIRHSMALCSDEYLLSALSVARSLADQICEVEDNLKEGSLPAPGIHWSDRVQVHLSSDGVDETSDISKNMHFRIEKADLLPDDTSVNGQIDDGMRRIYSLGLVFYEIFSGGERPPEMKQSKGGGGESDGESIDEMCQKMSLTLESYEDNVDILSFDGDEEASFNVADAMSIFDDIDPDDFMGLNAHLATPKPAEHVERTFSIKSDIEFPWTEELSQDLSEGSKFLHPLPFNETAPIDPRGELSIFDRIDDEYVGDPLGNLTFDALQNTNPRKKRTRNCHYKVYDVSVEPLKAKCLPERLCDLVGNMIACADGTAKGEDSYCEMSEVRDDLQHMLDKPAIYLYDQDMGRAGLQIGDKMFGRNAELSTVKDAYRRSISGGSEFVVISAAPGHGKSVLAHEFGKFVSSDGGIFLSGKFDQLQQGKPFSALASTFDQYCGILLHEDMTSTKEKLASKLMSTLGRESYHLAKIIPNLASILSIELSVLSIDDDCINAQKRVQYLLCQFVEVISSSSSVPITLFLDDLQWTDDASIAVVNQLLFVAGPSSHKKFFFLGCAREKDSTTKWLPGVDILVSEGINIKLDCMDEHMLNTMVSETLCLLPRLTRTLSNIIFHKTKGGLLFVSRLMRSLSKEGLLRPSLSRRRWEWDKEKIECKKSPDDVAMFLKNSIRELPEHVILSLCTISCFGASQDFSFIRTLERALKMKLFDNLDIAVAKGLLDKIGSQYRFSHDCIQEAAFNMIKDRRRSHFAYGLSLAALSVEQGTDEILFVAVNQLNHAGPSAVEHPSQSFIIADLNMEAGKKAMGMSDFKLALFFFDHGISFLGKAHWTEHYNLSLELFELAAKCALTNSDPTRVKLLYDEVSKEAHLFKDTLDIAYTNIQALYSASNLEEARTKTLYVLNKLDVTVSGDPNALLSKTKSILAQYSDEQLLSRPVMTDTTKLMVMKLLSLLQKCLFQTNPKLQPVATLQLVQYSLRYGMSGLSSVGFVFYGSFLACLGEIPTGYRYVKIAIKLAEKMNARDCMGDVLVMGGQVMGYVEPLQSIGEVMVRGHANSLMTGNISSAKLSLASRVVCERYSGKQLSDLKSTMDDAIRQMSSESTLDNALLQFLPLYRSTLAMIGDVDDVHTPMILGSKITVETEKERKIMQSNLHFLKSAHFQKIYVGFMFRRFNEVKQLANAYDAIAALPFRSILISQGFQTFYFGLISFWVARRAGGEIWYNRGKEAIEKMKSYSSCSSWNFSHKLLLLQAEQSFYLKEFESAKRYYDDAILSAKDHRFVHEEALACELAAYFLLERSQGISSIPYFLRAQRNYREW